MKNHGETAHHKVANAGVVQRLEKYLENRHVGIVAYSGSLAFNLLFSRSPRIPEPGNAGGCSSAARDNSHSRWEIVPGRGEAQGAHSDHSVP